MAKIFKVNSGIRIDVNPGQIDTFVRFAALATIGFLVLGGIVALAYEHTLPYVAGGLAILVGLMSFLILKQDKFKDEMQSRQFDKILLANKPDISAAEVLNGRKSIKHDNKLEMPEGYDFGALTSYIAEKYDEEAGIIVVQYGSSVISTSTPESDTDYIVLVHGNLYEKKPKKVTQGFLVSKSFDIHEQIFDSFLFGAIMGKPFELSVAIDGVAVDAHQIDDVYFDWVSVMVSNLTYYPHYIAEQLIVDLKSYRVELQNKSSNGEWFSAVVCMYWILSLIIQIGELNKMPKKVKSKEIYKLAKFRNLAEKIEDESAKRDFLKICKSFKGSEEELDWKLARDAFFRAQETILKSYGN